MFSPDSVEATVALLGLAGTTASTAIAMIWKLSKWQARTEANDDAHDKTIKEMQAAFGKIAANLHDISIAFAEMKAEIRQRERATDKLEGKVEQNQEIMMRLAASIQQCTGSLTALWQTLQKIHPEQVPPRASDRDIKPS